MSTEVVEQPQPQYDSTQYMNLIRSRDDFLIRMPDIMKKVRTSESWEQSGPIADRTAWAQNAMYVAVKDLSDNASARVVNMLYGQYASEHQLEDRTKDPLQITTDGVIYPMILRLELDERQKTEWELYLQTARPSREFALRTIGNLQLSGLPEPAKVFDRSLHPVLHDLERANYQIVASVFPDLSDEEAKRLFGGRTLTKPETRAEDVYMRAEPDSRYFEGKCIECKYPPINTAVLFDPVGNS